MSIPIRTLAVPLGVAVATLAVAAGPAAPTAAHPFGPPSTARISADGSEVVITWQAAEDDWVALGQSLGAFEDPATGTVSTELTGEQKLQRSTAVRDYLLDRIVVAQNGKPCASEVTALENLLNRGAEVTFDCSGPVAEVDVTLDALTDLNEAYRTMLTAETPATPARTLFTATEPTQRLGFSPTGGPAAVTTVAVGTGVAALAVVGLLTAVRIRRARRRS
ncbi:hypothetical protein GA0070618_4601 [Micromonospora echinospora]|uniref:MYXO-CTERM domain-containing protein n=1 Tax=Micromonospora echinospora TaxID=1877 RepID=A0A1C4Z023_MICEC|nr:hypothetical protein [Micromonospora echinospora]SCF26310.1 hypothetical protein GA0070618_4601 [Micromonospora echinospora]